MQGLERASYSLGFSPCPNDTYIFDALLQGRLSLPVALRPCITDVEELNQLAARRSLDITKTSLHAWFHLLDQYQLLPSGAALGRGCGPLLISKTGQPLTQGRVALPGAWTTASLLFGMALPGEFEIVQMPFDRIMPALAAGEVDAGVIIHESRFTYAGLGLKLVLDLGQWWEEYSKLPLPLGGILVARDLPEAVKVQWGGWIQESILFAKSHPEAPKAFIQAHAQEMSPAVQAAHIELYVNEFSLNLGAVGRAAVQALYQAAQDKGLLPGTPANLNGCLVNPVQPT